jgi:drug/metabolite transporter (DMT)-like permease
VSKYGVAPPAPPAATILAEPQAAQPLPSAERRSTLLLTLAALLFSLMAVCAKRAVARLPGPEVACLRFGLGLLSIAVPLLMGRPLRPHSLSGLFLRGLFGGGAVLMYFATIAHLPVGIATLLNSSSPLFVALFAALFLSEPIRLRTVLALLVTTAGVTLVVLGGSPAGVAAYRHTVLWSLIGVGSAVLSGAAVTTLRSVRQREGSWEIFLSFCLVGGVITGVPTALSWVQPTWTDAFYVVLMGVFSIGGQILMTHALRDVQAVTAGLILQLTPITTFLLGVLLLGEQPTLLGGIGAAVTIAGVTWAMRVKSH